MNNNSKSSLIWYKSDSEKSLKRPTSREGFALVYMDDKDKYLLFSGVSHTRYSDVYTIDIKEWKWSNLNCSGEIPKEISYCAYWYDSPYFFFNGGKGKEIATNDTYFLNTNTLVWRKTFVLDYPSSRFYHCAVKVPNEEVAYIFGGFGEKANKCLADICKFNYSNSTYY